MQEAYLAELRDKPDLNPYISILSSIKKSFFDAFKTIDDIRDEDFARRLDEITQEIINLSKKIDFRD